MSKLIQLVEVTKTFRLGKIDVTALDDVSLDVEQGDFLSLAGPSGSGKSTLLNLVGALDRPTRGKVLLGGEDLAAMSDAQVAQARLRRIGFIFQNFNLLAVLTVYENVQYPLILLGLPAAEQASRVDEALAAVGLGDRAHHRPDELSGGQRQRVAIARALVTRPDIVLADEPTANLDSKTGASILGLMEELNRQRGVTFFFASHDQGIIGRAKRVVDIRDGRVTADRRV